MMENMASQVRELKSDKPLRPFKADKLKILCIGNCVVNKLSMLLGRSAKIDALFISNLYNWGTYEKQSYLDRMDEADIVVSLYAKPELLRHSVEEQRALAGDKTTFVPMVWIDGACSFEAFSINGRTEFFGADPLFDEARRTSFDRVSKDFLHGRFSTRPAERIAASIESIRKAEPQTVPIADYIEETYRDAPVSICIGHPAPNVIRTLFERLAERLDLTDQVRAKFNATTMGNLALPLGRRAFTPYDKDELGLAFDHEPDWLLKSNSILQLMRKRFEKGDINVN